jgi:hypothetical protein
MNALEVMRRVLTAYDTHDLLGMEAHMQDLRRAIEQADANALTDKEFAELARWADEHEGPWYLAYGRAIERRLKKRVFEQELQIECQRCGRFIK